MANLQGRKRWLHVLAGMATCTGYLLLHVQEDTKDAGELAPQLPTFSMQQVQQQNSRSWVVYRHGVYDVTDFAGAHPGGTKVLRAAGKSVELFWRQSEPHTREGVPETLEELRVGNLEQQDFDRMEELKNAAVADTNVSSAALQRLFFIEQVPVSDVEAFELQICGEAGEELSLSPAELKKSFKQHKVATTIRCAAGASTEKTRVPAEWTGVLLVDVLASVGMSTAVDIEQVRFEALDTDAQGRPFGTSIPATTALDRNVGVLLAYQMNGESIPREHGFPLRVIVPGTTGARNVKFVHRVILM